MIKTKDSTSGKQQPAFRGRFPKMRRTSRRVGHLIDLDPHWSASARALMLGCILLAVIDSSESDVERGTASGLP